MLKVLFFYLFTLTGNPANPVVQNDGIKVDWVGHWECYSWITEGKVLGTIDIEKVGKYYRIKYSYTAEQVKEGTNEQCPMIGFTMDGEDDGKGSLITDLKGFKFTYDKDSELIMVTANEGEAMFGASNCVGDFFSKVK